MLINNVGISEEVCISVANKINFFFYSGKNEYFGPLGEGTECTQGYQKLEKAVCVCEYFLGTNVPKSPRRKGSHCGLYMCLFLCSYIMKQKSHFHEIFLLEVVRREKREMKPSMPVNTILLDSATISSF